MRRATCLPRHGIDSKPPRLPKIRYNSSTAAPQSRYENVFISHPTDHPQAAHLGQHVEIPGLLHGRGIAIKDNICVRGAPTTCASRMLEAFVSPYDATLVELLRAHGAFIAGKTNLDEFGMGSHSMHSMIGPVRDTVTGLSVGGSSGGSAAAVASGECWGAIGTDTGGSVRLPAAYTGIIGFKPSYGLISRWGVVAYANSLDTVGILATNPERVRKIFRAISKHDSRDPTSLTPSTRARLCSTSTPSLPSHQPLRIGVPLDYNISSLHPTIKAAWARILQTMQSYGHHILPVHLPSTRHALPAYYIIAPAEASSNLAKYDGVRYGSRATGSDAQDHGVLYAATRAAGFGPEVKRRILLGAYSLSAEARDNYFVRAQRVRRLVCTDFDAVFAAPNPLRHDACHVPRAAPGVDVLLCPTAPSPPPALEEVENLRPVDVYAMDVFTVPASLAGLPAVSVPVDAGGLRGGEGDRGGGANVGMQVIGQFGSDGLVLDVAGLLCEIAGVGNRNQ